MGTIGKISEETSYFYTSLMIQSHDKEMKPSWSLERLESYYVRNCFLESLEFHFLELTENAPQS